MPPSNAGVRTTTISRATWANKAQQRPNRRTPPGRTGRRFSFIGSLRGRGSHRTRQFAIPQQMVRIDRFSSLLAAKNCSEFDILRAPFHRQPPRRCSISSRRRNDPARGFSCLKKKGNRFCGTCFPFYRLKTGNTDIPGCKAAHHQKIGSKKGQIKRSDLEEAATYSPTG